jgi:hypothetical protein
MKSSSSLDDSSLLCGFGIYDLCNGGYSSDDDRIDDNRLLVVVLILLRKIGDCDLR